MRAYPFHMMLVAALGLAVPAAFGAVRPSHAAKPPAHTAKKVVETAHASTRGKHGHLEVARATRRDEEDAAPARTKLVHGRRVPVEPAETRLVGGRRVPVATAEPVRTKLVHGRRVAIKPEPVETKLVHGRRVPVEPEPAPRLIAHAQKLPAIAAPEPEPEPAEALEPIHVTHDRKQHFQAEPAGDGADDTPRKATTADFLSVDTPPAAVAAPAPPAPKPVKVAALKPAAPATIIRTSPTAGVVVGAKVELKPTPLPVVQVAPEPLVSLYDKRGRLVVPPALKGSHEVLVHQNIMADSDGLERVQDDEDLSRMRASKMLVALPENEGIQIDERLPYNRRYSRPWTAAFLTALARAHYARFHSPLQVNSAVRTVEFQHQLIRTNGNAAPAEGETASPHLTGQAVDLAKHGLSMTEIAWLRGYLLPLVQEGKVDVEEEFQQSCFHISVYKRYLPQPAGKRSIADKRLPGSTLAVALP